MEKVRVRRHCAGLGFVGSGGIGGTSQEVHRRGSGRRTRGHGLEVKTHLAKGAALVYFWKTTKGEAVLHDFHGEPVDAEEDEFESFIEDKAASESRGVLIAPFTGLHGWYWKNTSSTPVTLVLQASGF
jgi:hypothetical protein